MTNQYKTIRSPFLRDLLFRVSDNVKELAPLLFHLKDMVRAEEACKWLIANRLTGRDLYGLWVIEYDKSILKVMARINQGLERDDKMRNVRLGKDVL